MTPFGTPGSETLFTFGIEDEGKRYLLQTTGWTKFFAIAGLIGSGILLLAAVLLFISGMQSNYSEYHGNAKANVSIITAIGCILGIGIFVYPIIMLLRFSNATQRSIQQNEQGQFSAALRYQRNIYRYFGILIILTAAITIIYLLLFAAYLFTGGHI